MNKILLDGQKRQNKPGHEKKEKFTNIAFYAQNMAKFLFLHHGGEIGTRLNWGSFQLGYAPRYFGKVAGISSCAF